MTEQDGEAVLVLTSRLDSTADLVVEHLNDRGVPVFRCDTAEFPTELTLTATLEGRWAGVLDNGHRALDLSCVRSVYVRRPEEFRLPGGMSEAGRRFAADLGAPVITKSLGAPVDTVVIDPADLDDSVRLCAHLFQEWIDKSHEVRLTVVGDRFFPVEIHAGSEAARIDWRTDYKSLTYRPTTIPTPVRERVATFMREFGLVFGAFDFIVTPDGDWRFLEVNPNGQWSWIEHRTGVPISHAIADLLEKGTTGE